MAVYVGFVAIVISLVALVYAVYLSFVVLSKDSGTDKMKDISNAIKEGAMAYMKRQYKTIFWFAIILTILLGILFGIPVAIGFLFGALLSAL